jgi:hypothetical protein
MTRLLMSACVAVLCLSSFAQAEECRPVDKGLKMIEDSGAVNARFLDGMTRARAAAYLNELPQPEPEQWTIVLAADMPDGSGILIGGIDGTLCLEARVERRYWGMVMAQIEGPRI